ncbi:MAG: methyltransferase domain-containing protein [Terracidiphilus sp.]|jgi:SAM-dependent methyltransferase
MPSSYDSSFYATYSDESLSSARIILELVRDIVRPANVVDVGCGIGTWLRGWQELGVTDVMGIDGDYVQPETLLIPQQQFQAMDLTRPISPGRRFDLVQSLEVAEHLPGSAAQNFVSFLCSLGEVVLFSAAVPYQGGTKHINEQWPEYWAKLFSEHQYLPVDVIRDRVWDDARVAYYYAQNSILFAGPGSQEQVLQAANTLLRERPYTNPLSRINPRKWHEKNERPMALEALVKALPASSLDFLRRASRKVFSRQSS